MALRRFWIDPESFDPSQSEIVITGDLAHHLRDVCRLDVGREVELLSGDGKARQVRVDGITKKEVRVRVLGLRDLPPLPMPHIHLLVSIPKLPKMDWILEKSVELGVHRLTPFVSEFSFLRKESEISDSRRGRWEKIVQGATQQCGRGDLMRVCEVTSLSKLLKSFNPNAPIRGLFPFEGASSKTMKEELRSMKVQGVNEIWAFVGSEGGFSEAEVASFKASGLEPLTLGEQVLRVETACLALVAILKYELHL